MTPMAQTGMIERAMHDAGHPGTVNTAWVRAFNRGIRYMNAGERSSYQIEIMNGLLYQNGIEFDTSKMTTQHSGSGVAVFIQSVNGTFYSSNHLGGRLVSSGPQSDDLYRSAGEWKVERGKIEWVSGQCTFCKPTVAQLVNAISDLTFQNALSQTSATTCATNDGADTTIDVSLPISTAYASSKGHNG